jgi:CHAT domain-containing protein
MMMGFNDKALDSFSKSLILRRVANDRLGEALTLTGIAKIYYQQNRQQESLALLDSAIELMKNDRGGQADALSIKGWVYSSLGKYDEALSLFNEALPLRRQAGDRSGEATTLFGIAEAERRRGNLLNARGYLESALGILESLGTRGISQQLRISYFASVQSYYESYIDLLQQLHKLYPTKGYTAAALHASERARARSLLESLGESKMNIRQDVDESLLKAKITLEKRINEAAERQRSLLAADHSEEQRADVARELQQLTKEYQQLQTEIRASNPYQAALIRPTPLSAQEIQQQVLDDHTMLLEYAFGEERSYLWAVTSNAIYSYELPRRETIETAARRVYELLTARNRAEGSETAREKTITDAKADAEYYIASMDLSRILLGPVVTRLGTKRLLISAPGILQLIPFSALPVPVGNITGSMSKPLVLDHEIVIIPSASTLAVQRRDVRGREQPREKLAVFGDPVFTKNDERVRVPTIEHKPEAGDGPTSSIKGVKGNHLDSDASGLVAPTVGEPLPRLFGTRWEALEITSLVSPAKARLSLDFNVDRASATDRSLAQYQIIHFATHAIVNNTHPELSALVLSLVDEKGRPQDGYLHAFEVINLNLPADLVVLSGCQTGVGKDIRGEGLMGLSRSFLYAGARRVVASLWSLNDKAAAELITRFYRRMLGPENLPPAAALRVAQIEMRKDKRWQSPYFWAAFVLQGEWR